MSSEIVGWLMWVWYRLTLSLGPPTGPGPLVPVITL